MDTFKVIQPSSLLAPYVKQYWFLTLENVSQAIQRLVPFGCMGLTFHRGNRIHSTFENNYLSQAYLSGIATNYSDIHFTGHVDFVCIIFHPTGIKPFFQISVSELSNQHIPVESLDDAELCILEKQINDNTENLACVKIIEQFLLRRIYKLDKYNDKRIETIIEIISKGETNLEQLARTACLGYKQFKRIFSGHTGSNPKEFIQIMRFRKLHSLLQQHSKKTITQLAEECGYYDKSHLIKEVKKLSGFTPAELLKSCDPVYSGYHALFRSAFIDLPPK